MVGLALIAPFFFYILIGVAAQKILRYPADGQRWLDAFIFYIALPALLFQSVRVMPAGVASLPAFLMVTTLITGLMFTIGWFIGRRNPEGDAPAVYALSASYSNIGYMGPALTVAALGPSAGAPAAFIFCADVLLIFSIWPAMISDAGRTWLSVIASLYKVISHPFIIGNKKC